MKDLQREILTQVAAGTISAEEGAARLEALESPAPASIATDSPASEAVRHVKVVSRFGNSEFEGDPSVTWAVADGPHRARQDGDTLVIEQSPVNEDTSFEFSRPQARVVVNGFEFGRRLAIRMNPSLPLTTNVQAGNLRMQGLNGPIEAEVQAGNCKVGEFRGPINLSVMAGNIDAYGRIDSGKSSISCEMGQVKVKRARDSVGRITQGSSMGKDGMGGASSSNEII